MIAPPVLRAGLVERDLEGVLPIGETGEAPAIGAIPEGQLRPLARLEPEQRPQAWQRAQELAGEEKLTAGHVERAAEEIAPKPQPAHDPYLGRKVGERCWWIEDGSERSTVRDGTITKLSRGQVHIQADGVDGAPSRLVMLAPDRLGTGGRPLPAAPPVPEASPTAPADAPAEEPAAAAESPAPAAIATEPAAAEPAAKPGALKSAEEIVAEKHGTAVPTTVGAVEPEAPMTMCMVPQDVVDWLAGAGWTAGKYLTRIKSLAYARGLEAPDVLSLLVLEAQ